MIKSNLKNNYATKKIILLKSIFTSKNVLISIIITLFFLIIYHIGTMITLPGIKLPNSYHEMNKSSFVTIVNLLSGGGFDRMSIFAIGVGPYITTQIIIQLLSSDLIRPLNNLAKSGEYGRKKIEVITRLLTLPFALMQSYAVLALILNAKRPEEGMNIQIFGFQDLNQVPIKYRLLLMMLLSSGSYIAIFFSDMITKRGVGNGMTILILSGIVGSIYKNFSYALQTIKFYLLRYNNKITIFLSCFLYVGLFIVLLFFVIFIEGVVRKIPIQQSGQGLITNQKDLPFFSIKLNSIGVIPVIFASSLITIPGSIVQFFKNDEPKMFIEKWFGLTSWTGIAIFFVLIILFTFFYSYVQINPFMLAENLQKNGKYIPGIKMGEDTQEHITKVLYRINWIGAPILGIIGIIPYVISKITKIPVGMALGGTGIIIMVSGCLELWNSIKSASTTSSYNFVKKNIDLNQQDEKIKEAQLW